MIRTTFAVPKIEFSSKSHQILIKISSKSHQNLIKIFISFFGANSWTHVISWCQRGGKGSRSRPRTRPRSRTLIKIEPCYHRRLIKFEQGLIVGSSKSSLAIIVVSSKSKRCFIVGSSKSSLIIIVVSSKSKVCLIVGSSKSSPAIIDVSSKAKRCLIDASSKSILDIINVSSTSHQNRALLSSTSHRHLIKISFRHKGRLICYGHDILILFVFYFLLIADNRLLWCWSRHIRVPYSRHVRRPSLCFILDPRSHLLIYLRSVLQHRRIINFGTNIRDEPSTMNTEEEAIIFFPLLV